MDKRGWGSLDDSEAITGDLGEAPELSGEGDREGTGTVEGMWLIAGGSSTRVWGQGHAHTGTGEWHRGNSVPSTNASIWEESTIPPFIAAAAFPPSDTDLKKTV